MAVSVGGLGPAVVAAIGYVDPGNVATNLSAGSAHGYLLLWVVVTANLVAILVQNLSAKLGRATGRSLPRLCRDHFPRPVARLLWAQAEAVTVATDVAEVLGGALALHLLLGLPLVHGAVLTGIAGVALLGLQSRGHHRFQATVAVLFGVILIGFLTAMVAGGPDVGGMAGGLVPRLDGPDSVTLATGILGATVMPHVIYLHSAMTAARPSPVDPGARRAGLRRERRGIALTLGAAGLVNVAMLVTAAAFFAGSAAPVETIEHAYASLQGSHAAVALLVALALLASGLASTGVGSYAGQVVMEGFLRRSVPLLVRRLASLVPAVLLLAVGVDATTALVLSQVVLSFGIPFALGPLLIFTARRDLMGSLVNRPGTTAVGGAISLLVVALNVLLLHHLLGG